VTAYRVSTPLCPVCREALEQQTIGAASAIVDLCAKCGGVWIDWEDGDLTALAREVPATAGRELPRSGPGACPRCNRPLGIELFLGVAEVLRCGDCAGAFLPYPSIGKVAASTPADERDERGEDGFWKRVSGRLRALLKSD
jgi:Zn-finger nucleic acid-binding protein